LFIVEAATVWSMVLFFVCTSIWSNCRTFVIT